MRRRPDKDVTTKQHSTAVRLGDAMMWSYQSVCLYGCLSVSPSVLLVGLCQGRKQGGGVVGSKCQKQDKRIRIEVTGRIKRL